MRAQIIVVATVLASVSLGASQEFDLQPDRDDVADLRAAGTFRCNFDGIAEIIIDDVDYRDGFASTRFIGNLGTDDMLAVLGSVTSSFIEVTGSGAANMLTVYAWRNNERRFVAVYSRHTGVARPSPSQLHGSCRALGVDWELAPAAMQSRLSRAPATAWSCSHMLLG